MSDRPDFRKVSRSRTFREPRRASPPRRVGIGLAASLAVLALLVLSGCSPSDPLQPIREQQASGDFNGSLQPLRDLLAKNPDDPETNYLYGRALSATGEISMAEWSLRKAMANPKWKGPAARQLAYGDLVSGNYDEAIDYLTKLLKDSPDDIPLLGMRAEAYARSHMHNEEALADVDRIEKLDPTNTDAMGPKIMALLALNRPKEAGEAIDQLGKLIEKNQLDPRVQSWYCATKSIFADDSGKAEEAAGDWEDCVKRFPADPNVVWPALDFYDGRKDFARSLEVLQKAVEQAPKVREFRVRLALRLRMMGRVADAEKLLRKATEAKEPSAASTAWFDLAKHYQELGKSDEAVDAFAHCIDRAKEVGGAPPQMLLEYADALVLAGRFDDALAVADQMTVEAHQELIRARVDQERGKPTDALKHFDRALELWPDNPWARYYSARAAEAAGKFDRAVEDYRYSIRIEPGATDARVRLARLLAAEKRGPEAIAMLRFQTTDAPLSLDGELLSLELWGHLGDGQRAKLQLDRFRKSRPAFYGAAMARFAKGMRARLGPAAAAQAIRSQHLDLTLPVYADALRELVVLSREATVNGAKPGILDAARAEVHAALAAHPDCAAFHEIQGLLLAPEAGRADDARAAYERALEIDPRNARAALGLGRLRLAQDPEAALALFQRAHAADPQSVDAARELAHALAVLGQPDKAAEQLRTLLDERPDDPGVATQLALLLESQPNADRNQIRKLSEQAVRFGGGDEARALLERVRGGAAAADAARASGSPRGV